MNYKWYLSYSPVINLLAIIIVDIISFISYEFYYKYYVYISVATGMSILNALDKLAMAKLLPYCKVSQFAVYALISFIPIFLIDFWVFGYESKGNRILQIVIGLVAIRFTYLTIKKNRKQHG